MIPSNLLTSLLRGMSQILSTPFPFPGPEGSARLCTGLASEKVTAPAGLPGVLDPEPDRPIGLAQDASSASLFF